VCMCEWEGGGVKGDGMFANTKAQSTPLTFGNKHISNKLHYKWHFQQWQREQCFVASTLYSAIFPFPKTHNTFLTCAKFWFYPVTQYSYSLRVSEYCCLMSTEVSRPIRDAVWELLHSIYADVVSISFTFSTQFPSVWIYFHRQLLSVMIHISADKSLVLIPFCRQLTSV